MHMSFRLLSRFGTEPLVADNGQSHLLLAVEGSRNEKLRLTAEFVMF